jgi:Flp pilus assembly protein TadG
MRKDNIIKSERGQIMLVFALVLTVLVLFTGMAIDAGILYVTKAKLSTSVDAACLTGMKTLSQGQPIATTLATEIFDANYGPNPPTPTITFPLDPYGDQQVKVVATVNVHTLFIRILPQFAIVPVGDIAVSTRSKLIMSVVLDRSGSMGPDGGEVALKNAVPTFVGDFDQTFNEVAMISFADNATVDVAINYNFISPIQNAVKLMNANGGTFGTGAGTKPVLSPTIGPPLSLAQIQNDSVVVNPGQNVVKVVVYFTDGLMNTIQDNFYCKGKGGNPTDVTLMNYGGYDSGTNEVDIFDPTSPTVNWCPNAGYGTCESGGPISTTGFPYDAKNDLCRNITGSLVTTFVPQQPGKCGDGSTAPCALSRINVTSEAQYRAIQTAISMRTETNPVPNYIFSIGLGNGVSLTTQAFLAQLANDPAYPATFIKSQPAGEFFYIQNCPSSTCTADVNAAFQAIAAKILLRLTQ